jgi:hypothetical protein
MNKREHGPERLRLPGVQFIGSAGQTDLEAKALQLLVCPGLRQRRQRGLTDLRLLPMAKL